MPPPTGVAVASWTPHHPSFSSVVVDALTDRRPRYGDVGSWCSEHPAVHRRAIHSLKRWEGTLRRPLASRSVPDALGVDESFPIILRIVREYLDISVARETDLY